MFEVGRVCTKIAGRDAGKRCVIIDIVDTQTVLIDGATRRRKCNVSHLIPEKKVLDIAKDASHEDVLSLCEKELGVVGRTTKPKKTSDRPQTKRVLEMQKKTKTEKSPSAEK